MTLVEGEGETQTRRVVNSVELRAVAIPSAARRKNDPFHVMSFGIKCLCAVAIKSPPNHRKTPTNVYLATGNAEVATAALGGQARRRGVRKGGRRTSRPIRGGAKFTAHEILALVGMLR
jgi:hypothetical protein